MKYFNRPGAVKSVLSAQGYTSTVSRRAKTA